MSTEEFPVGSMWTFTRGGDIVKVVSLSTQFVTYSKLIGGGGYGVDYHTTTCPRSLFRDLTTPFK